jgi:predicted ester cyclase
MLRTFGLEGPSMSEKNKAVIRRLFDDHWNAKDEALLSDLFAPTISLSTPDNVYTGHKGAAALLQSYAIPFPDFHLAIEELLADADKVVVKWTFTGTHSGPLTVGKRVKVPNCIAIYRIADGKIAEGTMSWNKYELLRQLGVVG